LIDAFGDILQDYVFHMLQFLLTGRVLRGKCEIMFKSNRLTVMCFYSRELVIKLL